MSTPSPQSIIRLPEGKAFDVVIQSPNYPDKYPGQMTFSQNPTSLEWTAAYSVPSVMLTEIDCPITQPASKIEFGFRLDDVTDEQREAGYVEGPYQFSFVPPGGSASEFTGTLKDPRPDQAEDTFTAKGNEVDPV